MRSYLASYRVPNWIRNKKPSGGQKPKPDEHFSRGLHLPQDVRALLAKKVGVDDRLAYRQAMLPAPAAPQSVRIARVLALTHLEPTAWPRATHAAHTLQQPWWRKGSWRGCLGAFGRLPADDFDSVLAAAQHIQHFIGAWDEAVRGLQAVPETRREAVTRVYARLVAKCPGAKLARCHSMLQALDRVPEGQGLRVVEAIAAVYRSHTEDTYGDRRHKRLVSTNRAEYPG